ncbi:hypothetical protein AYI70_g6768 [Smittium culicis]|uniref:Uncharacterized protein n=1 Tax=Smittium culicis TaxID=133412 RepID=A0A1R1XNH3_9FUNG|nr:hypothetical protein AYI70_g6768 [Smittium culicis]
MSNPGKKPNSADEWSILTKAQQQLIDLQKAVDRGIEIDPDDIDRVVEEASEAPRLPPTTLHEKKMMQMIDMVTKSLTELSQKKRLDPIFKALMTPKARQKLMINW